jgi:exonuclease VII small subunit
MATIALYKSKLNQMPSLISTAKTSVSSYNSELFSLKTKVSSLNSGVCNLDEAIQSIQASTQTQEQKITSLQNLQQNVDEFISDVVRVDSDVATLVNKNKENFYKEFPYLKPDCEKTGWEKFCEGLKKVGDWCKENWIIITTVAVVIAIAILAVVTFGVAIAAVAAIAGIIALTLCVADIICMVATDGKDLSTVFREKGWNVLADVFQGLQIGCDIVSIVFPAGAVAKSIAKIGIRASLKVGLTSAKIAGKEFFENTFKQGFTKGLKSFLKTMFNTVVFDIDDIKPKNFKGVMGGNLPVNNGHWSGNPGNSDWIPDPDYVPVKNASKNTKTWQELGVDRIPYKEGEPVFSQYRVQEFDTKISLTSNRDANFASVQDEWVKQGRFESRSQAKKFLKNNQLTIHELPNMKGIEVIPSAIHGVDHIGGVGNAGKIESILNPQASADIIAKNSRYFFDLHFQKETSVIPQNLPRVVYNFSQGYGFSEN